MNATGLCSILLLSLPMMGCSGGCTKTLPHGGADPVYELRGLHAAVPCEGCHGPGEPKTLSRVCMDCHEQDRSAPDHYPGKDCGSCHVEFGWDIVETTITYTTGLTGETGTPPLYDHSALSPSQLCWDCHEAARPERTPPHYKDEGGDRLYDWDCGPCHEVNDWTSQYVHPTRTPHATHGKYGDRPDPAQWIVACTTCHPTGLASLDCSTCHLNIFEPSGHFGSATAPYIADRDCTTCHINADL